MQQKSEMEFDTTVEFDDEDIIPQAESYMAQLEHHKMARKGPVKF